MCTYTDGFRCVLYHLILNLNIKFCIYGVHLDQLMYTLTTHKRFTLKLIIKESDTNMGKTYTNMDKTSIKSFHLL